MSKITVIKHVLAPGYTSGIATGMTVLGPTADGHLHFEFVRDVQMTMEEPMNVTEIAGPDGRVYQQTTPAGASVVQTHKELIATITISSKNLTVLAAGLKKLAEQHGVAIGIPNGSVAAKENVIGKIATIKRAHAPGYRSGLATSITLLGPTSDGFLHLEFIRDLQMTIEESINITSTSGSDGQQYQLSTPIGSPVVESRKELLATLSINAALLVWFVLALQRLAEKQVPTPTPTPTSGSVGKAASKKGLSRKNVH